MVGTESRGPETSAPARTQSRVPRPRTPVVSLVGGFFLVMGGVHLVLVAADPQIYRHFADHALFGFVRDGWRDVFMAAPALYGLMLMAGEVVVGSLLLIGGRCARVGWVAVIVFHVLLLLFGWWNWLWCVPVLALLTWGLVACRFGPIATDGAGTEPLCWTQESSRREQP